MKKIIKSSFRQGSIVILMLATAFMVLEPTIGFSATTAASQFTISQTVTSEVAFSTPASNVTLGPSLGGITGGTSNGGTQVIVTTNDHLGYTMTLTASSSVGMIGNASSTNSIPAYIPASGITPDFAFTVPANKAYFGYTVEASTTADLATAFKDNGSVCGGAGTADAANSCWVNASSSAVTVVNRTFQTPYSGATTTLKFRVTINSNPNPVIPDDVYVATTTLTVTTN